jgi:hypothetical protein
MFCKEDFRSKVVDMWRNPHKTSKDDNSRLQQIEDMIHEFISPISRKYL